jgi:hypothetical protein
MQVALLLRARAVAAPSLRRRCSARTSREHACTPSMRVGTKAHNSSLLLRTHISALTRIRLF